MNKKSLEQKKMTRFFLPKIGPVIVSRRRLVCHENGDSSRATELTGLFLCSSCKKFKKIDKFYLIKYKTVHRVKSWCKRCFKKTTRKSALVWYYKNKLKALNRIKKWQNVDRKNRIYKYWDKKYFSGNREKVLIRDNYLCLNCGNGNNLLVHHKDGKGRNYFEKGLKSNNCIDNLITLCKKCHAIIHCAKQETLRQSINPSFLQQCHEAI